MTQLTDQIILSFRKFIVPLLNKKEEAGIKIIRLTDKIKTTLDYRSLHGLSLDRIRLLDRVVSRVRLSFY